MAIHGPPTAPGIAPPQPGTPTHHPDGHAFIGGRAKEMGARSDSTREHGKVNEAVAKKDETRI